MGLFNFRKGKNEPVKHAASAPVQRPAPTQRPAPPQPGSAADVGAKLALEAVKQFYALDGVALDYSPESLRSVDRLLTKYAALPQSPTSKENMVAVLAGYLGGVMVRHLRGEWVFERDTPIAPLLRGSPGFLCIKLVRAADGEHTDEQYVNVTNKIIARLDGAQDVSVKAYYDAISSTDLIKCKPLGTIDPKAPGSGGGAKPG